MDPSLIDSSTVVTPSPSDRSTLERVLDAAAALFWKKGYSATTTREIAAAAGIQQASLYYHVHSKEELLYQLCVSSMEELLGAAQFAVDQHTGPLDKLRALVGAHLTTLLKHQVWHVTMVTQLRALSEPHQTHVRSLRQQYANLVRCVLQEAQAARMVRNDIPSKYLYLSLLNILNWALLWFRQDRGLNADQMADVFSEIYLNGAIAIPLEISLELPNLNKHFKKPAPGSKAPKTARMSTSERLLEVAAMLFAKNGYDRTSTRQIAAALGIEKTSLYWHIGTKEELLHEICKSSLQQIRSDVLSALEGVSDRLDRIRTLIRVHMQNLLCEREMHSVSGADMHLLSPERRAEVRSLRDSYESLVRSVLRDAQNAGVLRQDILVKYLCLSLLGLMNRVELWYRPSGPLTPDEFGELLGVIFLTGVTVRRR